jgi:hypothetical protein
VCRNPAILELTVAVSSGQVKYKASDLRKVDFFSSTWQPPRDFDACRDLKDLRVRIAYKPSTDARFAGEIVTVEILK